MKENKKLTTQPIPALIRQIAIPASVGYFFHTMYNVVDTYFGGMLSTQALAALSLSLPVFFIIIALGTGISTGATALIGNAFGAGNRREARVFAVQGISFGVLVSIVLTWFGIFISPFLFSLLGATGEYLAIATTYMNTIFLGSVFFMLLHMLNAVLNAMGDTRPFRNFLIIGFAANVVLDPWFIYGGFGVPPLKIVGIALATVLVQCFGCIYLGFRVYKTGLLKGCGVRDLFPRFEPFKEIAKQGFPASINILTVATGIFVITYFISRFGKGAVAAYGAAMRVEQIVLTPTMGLHIATLTIVAQNHGARLFQRIKETLRKNLQYGAILMAIGTIIVLIAANRLMGLFTDDATVADIGAVYLRIDALVFYAYVALFIHVSALQWIKRPMYAIWIVLFRQIIAPGIVFHGLIKIMDF